MSNCPNRGAATISLARHRGTLFNLSCASTCSAANGEQRAMRVQSTRGRVQRGSVIVMHGKRGRLVEGAAHSPQA
eukprot:4704918-Pleurochrysis_carterae.AAC.1